MAREGLSDDPIHQTQKETPAAEEKESGEDGDGNIKVYQKVRGMTQASIGWWRWWANGARPWDGIW